MTRRHPRARLFHVLAVTLAPTLSLGFGGIALSTDYDYANTAGSTALATGTSATVSLQGSPVTIDISNKGAGVTLGTVKQFTFSRQNGNTPDGSTLAYPTWSTLAGYSGSLATGTFDTTPEAVVSLLTSVSISRLEYQFTMNPTGSVTSNDVQFNFAVPVPEPSAASPGLRSNSGDAVT